MLIWIILSILIIGVMGISCLVGWNLTHPQRKQITANPGDYGLNFQEVKFSSREDYLQLAGWFLPTEGKSSVSVIIAHGYGENRQYDYIPVLPLARFLVSQGYNVLLFDFRNAGESEGSLTSVGQYEVRDILGAVDFLAQEKEQQKIIVHGFSMGASTAILAAAQEERIAGVIADCPFADLESYLKSNLPVWTKLPAFPFNHLVMRLIPWLTRTDPKEVSPVRVIDRLASKGLLLIHAAEDTTIPAENSKQLLQAAQNPQGELWLVPGANHVECYGKEPEAYQKKVINFLRSVS